MTIGRKCLVWSALGVLLMATGCAQSPQGQAARQGSGDVAGEKETAPKDLVAAANKRHSDMPRKVLLGTALSGGEIFGAPLGKRLDKMDELVAAMAAETEKKYPGKRLDFAMLNETFLTRPGQTAAEQAVALDEIRERVGTCTRKNGCYLLVPMVLQDSVTPPLYSNAGRTHSLPRTCSSRNARIVSYQRRALFGLRIQWFSSGK